MKLEQNDKSLLFSETTIPDIFFSEYLSELPSDYLKIYLYIMFLSKYGKDIKLNDLSKKLNREEDGNFISGKLSEIFIKNHKNHSKRNNPIRVAFSIFFELREFE